MGVKYAKIEKHALKVFFIYSLCICNYIIAHWLQANEGVSLHTWLEGSLSYVDFICGQNPLGSDYKCIWLYNYCEP